MSQFSRWMERYQSLSFLETASLDCFTDPEEAEGFQMLVADSFEAMKTIRQEGAHLLNGRMSPDYEIQLGWAVFALEELRSMVKQSGVKNDAKEGE